MSISSKAINDVQTKQIIIEYMFEETSPKNWDFYPMYDCLLRMFQTDANVSHIQSIYLLCVNPQRK